MREVNNTTFILTIYQQVY